jgi:hypothetical protein
MVEDASFTDRSVQRARANRRTRATPTTSAAHIRMLVPSQDTKNTAATPMMIAPAKRGAAQSSASAPG